MKKRTDSPCTCGSNGDGGHWGSCLSLYPKQPAPGDVPQEVVPTAGACQCRVCQIIRASSPARRLP